MNSTILHSLLQIRQDSKSKGGIRFKIKESWLFYSWYEVAGIIEQLSYALAKFGVKRGDRVVILSNTRPEWMYADLAILSLGAVTVPIYPSTTADDVVYILKDCQPTAIFYEDTKQAAKIEAYTASTLQLKASFDRVSSQSSPDFSDLLAFGRHERQQHDSQDFNERLNQSNPADIATILYTSGTTGEPKGVVLTHANLMAELFDLSEAGGITANDVFLTCLPYAQIVGRLEGFLALQLGATLAFAESIEKLRINLKEIRPTLLVGVPRIFEKVYASFLNKINLNTIQRRLTETSIEVGRRKLLAFYEGKPVPIGIAASDLMIQQTIGHVFRSQFGGRLRFAISGGAPLSPEIAEFFYAMGLLILEGYGLTETTGGISFNTPHAFRFGTVGKTLKSSNVQLAEDGEVLVTGSTVMSQYFRPDASAFTDSGAFKTGDIGEWTPEGFLKITGRKKDLIKTAGGKFVAPQKLESLLQLDPWISHALIYGDQKKYVVALLTLNPEPVIQLAKSKQLSYQDFSSLIQLKPIQDQVREIVQRTNARLSSFETIKNFKVLNRDFTVADGELTPTLKLRRKHCSEKYKGLIESLYEI